MLKTLITSRDPKGLHAVGLFEAVYNKSKLDDARAQRLNERGGELQDGIAKLITELSASNQFADEEVCSNRTYPKEYKGPKPIADQIKAIAKIFNLNPSQTLEFAKSLSELPDGAEGWFAIPRWQSVAKTYNEAVQKVLDLIKRQRKGNFYNYRGGEIGETYLRQHERTAKKLQMLGDQQTGFDILVVAAQFGFRHRGRSVRRTHEVFMANEFGLGAFKAGCMLLTHPERFVSYDDLWIDCAGNEYAPDAAGDFHDAPCFRFRVGGVLFGTRWVGLTNARYGSASGFLQQ
ncbi:hypothetical protein KKF60_02275 [Patescibacteria group bacterium]|nr:hypothetical protein [Patescibacteria group bacterium]MBU4458694.1 hypothetical protein [Patescibacteria group bacterium]MCG2696289.1 hypothetical protein [Candidatus Portnoybacteria bacterium]